jgi:hypothetical protein
MENDIIMQGKMSAHGECLWTFLGGTGKWKGVTGSGTYQHVSSSKPRPDGTGEGCTTHSGKYTLP